MRSTSTRILVAATVALSLLGVGVACGPPQSIKILTPGNGTFTQAATINVTGSLTAIGAASIASLTVNGTSVTPVAGAFSHTVTLTPGAPKTPKPHVMVRINRFGQSSLRS